MGMGIKKPKKQKPIQKKKEEEILKSPEGKEIKGVVRIASKDIKGNLPLNRALDSIKGIGYNLSEVLANIAAKDLSISPQTLIGELSEEQLQRLEYIIYHPLEFGVPKFYLNRQRDYISNEPRHLLGNDLIFAVKQDIQHEKDSQTWRGFRHTYSKKVRGQRTRTTGRKGMTVGVLRKAAKAAGATAKPSQEQKQAEKDKKAK
ncbi:MAG: 30S ribosomal protein S13 [Candidatus Anstonellaceae archaeon]